MSETRATARAHQFSSLATLAIVAAVLSVLFYVLHPRWYLDAVIYARDIQEGDLWPEPGHVLWRPFGAVAHSVLRSVWPTAGPLDALRVLSSLSSGVLCVLAYLLARRLELSKRQALTATGILAVSQAAIALGGSGSSYIPAAMFLTASLLCFVHPTREWGRWDGLLGTLAIVLAGAFWGTAVFLMLGFLAAAYLYSSGGWRRRAGRAFAVGFCATATLVALLALAYAMQPRDTPLLVWVRSASHGIPTDLSILGFARAGYGLLLSFAHLGSVGREVKAMLLGSSVEFDVERMLLLGLVLSLFAVFATLAGVGIWRSIRREPMRRWVVVFAGLTVPLLVFASIWQGSDIERFTPVLAPLIITLMMGVRAVGPRFSRLAGIVPGLVLGGLLVLNLVTFVVPRRFGDEAMTWVLGREASKHIEEDSLLVVTGQELWGAVTSATRYLWNIEAFNVHYIVASYGVDAWRDQLCDKVDEALAAGVSVAVQSDMLGRPTPGGIGLIEAEYPEPSMDELGEMFGSWSVADSWHAGRFEFFTVTPPTDGFTCLADSRGR